MRKRDDRDRTSYWSITEIVLWVAIFGASLWLAPRFIPFGIIWCGFCAHRLAGAVALFRAGEISLSRRTGIQVLAGWLYVTRTLSFAVLLGGFGAILLIARPDRAGILFGGLLLFASSPFLILGVQLTHGWHDALKEPAPPEPPTSP